MNVDGLLRNVTAEKLMLDINVDFLARMQLKDDLISAIPNPGPDHGAITVVNPSGSVLGTNQTIDTSANPTVYAFTP